MPDGFVGTLTSVGVAGSGDDPVADELVEGSNGHLDEEDTPVRDRIIAAALRSVDEGGEASVRVSSVAREAGVTQGMISYYFGGREGLIREVQRIRYTRSVTDDTEFLDHVMRSVTSVEQLRLVLAELTRSVVSGHRASNRAVRIMTLGAASSRPELADVLAESQTALVDAVEEIIRIGQARNLVRTDLDARAIAVFVQAYSMGLIVADLDRRRPSDAELAAVIDEFTLSILAAPVASG